MSEERYKVWCTCGRYSATFSTESVAQLSAQMHAALGGSHYLTCTVMESGEPVVVFVCQNAT